MMYSIYHFFKSLVESKRHFLTENKLEDFPFNENLLSCRNKGTFPDMAIRLNTNRGIFTGGELIELKDSNTYTVSSFNSTIPTGRKEIAKIITGENSGIKQQMQENGNDIYSLPVRDVFYLVRGKKKGDVKICLVHGSFFETIRIEDLKRKLLTILSEQQSFSKVRDVNKSSVKLRFRVMTEVKAEGNILNPKKYPEIKDNTLNFVLPCHNENEEKEIIRKAESTFSKTELKQFRIFKIKHHFNGYFLILQSSL